MKSSRFRKLILLVLGTICLSYYPNRPSSDLTEPEFFWPDAKGNHPGPKSDMKPVWVVLDKELASVSNNQTAAMNALSEWNSIAGSSARVNFLGTKDFSGDWRDRLTSRDGFNGIELVKRNWIFGPYTVAMTSLQYNVHTSKLTEVDIFFNGVNWTFGNYPAGGYKADFQNILTHELGHFLGLGHSQVSKATMSNNTNARETKRRTLEKDDKQGIRWIYPKTKADLPPPSLWRLEQASCSWVWTYDWSTAIANQADGLSSFCLYAAGIRGTQFQIRFISETTSAEFSPVSNLQFLSENQLQFDLDLNQLPLDSYRLELELEDGKVGKKSTALIVQ
jgi:hypothetical protein